MHIYYKHEPRYFFLERQIHTQGREKMILIQRYHIFHLKSMVTFKKGWGKLTTYNHVKKLNLNGSMIMHFEHRSWMEPCHV